MLGTKREIEFHHPYLRGLSGPGRWYEAYSFNGELIGYVWTNDTGGFGIITTTMNYSAQKTLDWFTYSRNYWGKVKTPVTAAFEAYYIQQQAWVPEGAQVPVSAGDLRTDLWETEMATDRLYIEYGVTLRDDGEVLELLRHDPTGTYIREGANWVPLDADADEDQYPTVYNQEWVEVDEDIIDFFDQNAPNTSLTSDDIQTYVL